MTVRLKRSTDTVGSLLKFKVTINDEKTLKITQGGNIDITLPKKNSVMQVKQFSGKSNKLTVNDGDVVEISNGPFVFWGFVLSLFLVPLATILLGVDRWIGLALVVIVYLVALQLIDSFKLKKINDASTPTK